MSYARSVVGRELVKHRDFPTKLYVFISYVANIGERKNAPDLLIKTLSEHPEIMDDQHAFAVAFAFGYTDNEPVEGIDIFSARLRGGWQGNPMYDGWTFENGIYIPKEKGVTCETGGIILGKEGELRRKSDLHEYLNTWPDIGELYD